MSSEPTPIDPLIPISPVSTEPVAPRAPHLIVPQTCKPVPTVEKAIGRGRQVSAYQLEFKLDGFRVLANVGEGDNPAVTIYTRSLLKQEGKLPHIEGELQKVLPPLSAVDGELTAIQLVPVSPESPTKTVLNNFDFVQSVMNSLPERSRELQKDYRPLTYVVFDLLWDNGEDIRSLPLANRRSRLLAYYTRAKTLGLLKYTRPIQALAATQENHDMAVALGYEGSVIKDRAKPYVSGKRGHGWHKIKKQPSIEAIIVGFNPSPAGKFKSTFGALSFGQYKVCNSCSGTGLQGEDACQGGCQGSGKVLFVRGAASGMDDATRLWMHQNRSELLGRVVEITHFGVFPDGIHFRHPNFLRMRSDKDPWECLWHDE